MLQKIINFCTEYWYVLAAAVAVLLLIIIICAASSHRRKKKRRAAQRQDGVLRQTMPPKEDPAAEALRFEGEEETAPVTNAAAVRKPAIESGDIRQEPLAPASSSVVTSREEALPVSDGNGEAEAEKEVTSEEVSPAAEEIKISSTSLTESAENEETDGKTTLAEEDKNKQLKVKPENEDRVEKHHVPAPAKYRVIYDKESLTWEVRKDGAKRVIRRVKTKEEALKIAKELSRSHETALVVHKRDGKFQKK